MSTYDNLISQVKELKVKQGMFILDVGAIDPLIELLQDYKNVFDLYDYVEELNLDGLASVSNMPAEVNKKIQQHRVATAGRYVRALNRRYGG